MSGKRCFLLFSITDLFYYDKIFSKNTDLILMEKHFNLFTCNITKYKIFHDFYNEIKYRQDEIAHLALNWYRNTNGVDTFESEKFSIPKVATGSFLTKFSHYFRDYLCMKNIIKEYEIIYKPQDTGFYFENIFNHLKGRIKIYPSNFNPYLYINENSFNERSFSIPQFSKAKYIFFSLFNFTSCILLYFKIGKSKNFIFSDWSYHFKPFFFKNYLYFGKNGLNPFKYTIYYIPENKFNSKLEESIIEFTNLSTPLLFSYKDWDDDLLSILRKYILYYFNKNKKYINYYYSYFNRLLSTYKPITITLPADTHEYYAILLQISNNMKIKSFFLSDGILNYENKYHFVLKDKENNNYLFDHVFAISDYNKSNYVNMGINDRNITIIKHPLFNYYKHIENNRRTEDVIILSYTPYDLNPVSAASNSIIILNDLIRTLVEFGYEKIHIKLKSKHQLEFTKLIISKFPEINFIILIDPLYLVLRRYKFKIAIGQSSTAVSEFLHLGDIYFIHEPYSNGLKDNQKFPYFDQNILYLSRDLDELIINLKFYLNNKYT